MPKGNNSRSLRIARHKRLRSRVIGTADRPRLSVFRSLNNIYVQIIDDSHHHTVLSVSSMDKEVRGSEGKKTKTEWSRLVGVIVAKKAADKGITQVVFDRGGYKYHGRLKILAEAAREGGLVF